LVAGNIGASITDRSVSIVGGAPVSGDCAGAAGAVVPCDADAAFADGGGTIVCVDGGEAGASGGGALALAAASAIRRATLGAATGVADETTAGNAAG